MLNNPITDCSAQVLVRGKLTQRIDQIGRQAVYYIQDFVLEESDRIFY